MNHFFSLLVIGSAAALVSSNPASAHTKLLKSNPAVNSVVANAPKTITLTFSERLVPPFSKFELTMPEHSGMKVPVTTAVSSDGKQIIGSVKRPLSKGAYKILWTAAGSDGHRMTGEVAFRVR